MHNVEMQTLGAPTELLSSGCSDGLISPRQCNLLPL